MLRRNAKRSVDDRLDELNRLAKAARAADNPQALLGIEGLAARVYFSAFTAMLNPAAGDFPADFDFNSRNRRPPRDPLNALLSFVYALLAKEMAVTTAAVGFDPYLGFYHQPRYGKPALALDLMDLSSAAMMTLRDGRLRGTEVFGRARW